MNARIRGQAGLTLIELTIVAALASVILGASVGHYHAFVSNQRLDSIAETIAADLRAGQQQSLARRQTVIAVFASSLYSVSADGAAIKVAPLPSDIVSTAGTITFSWLGSTSASETITIRSTITDRTRQIAVSPDTGRVRVD